MFHLVKKQALCLRVTHKRANLARCTVQSFFLIFLSAILLVLPFHFGFLWPLAFVAFVPYFFALQSKSRSAAFRISYLFGFLFFLLLGYWLALVSFLGFILLAGYLALYFACFGALACEFLNSADASRKALWILPALWVLLEYLRGWMISGFPWALLAYSQWRNVPFIQLADVTGAYGISFLLVFFNLVLFEGLRKKTDRMTLSMIFIVSLSAVYFYGFLVLKSREAHAKQSFQSAPHLRVAVLQGNVPQEEKWDVRIKDIIFEKYKRLTLMGAMEKSDLIVWPETSFPGFLEDEPVLAAELRHLVRQSQTSVLVGAPTLGSMERGLRFYNSAVLYRPDGEEKKRYDKVHLVPFGEYIPFEALLGVIRHFVSIGHFSPGEEKTVFVVQSRARAPGVTAHFSTLICFEDIFPGLVRDFVNRGADFLVNMTNDAWFGKTSAPYQHAQASVFRAVENRVPVIRATNTGLSCFISPEGRLLATVQDKGREIFVTGHKTLDIVLRKTPSFYTRFGDLFVWMLLVLLFLAFRRRARKYSFKS